MDKQNKGAWNRALRAIEKQVNPAQVQNWIAPIGFLGIQADNIRLSVPNRYHKDWFEDHYLPSILENLLETCGTAFRVEFVIEDEHSPTAVDGGPPMPTRHPKQSEVLGAPERSDIPGAVPPVPALSAVFAPAGSGRTGVVGSGLEQVQTPGQPLPTGLLERCSFDRFVVGPTNQFAHAAAKMVGDSPGARWNPLFLYGGVGLGKTHLLHAIGQEIHRNHPNWRIKLITAENFVTEFISSIRGGATRRAGGKGPATMEEFRRTYREEPDVLLIDDIQFLSGKDSSQDEFFHTFNALHQSHKQIVLTCDKLPAELPGLEDRLRSRFTWGLIAEIEKPELETRVAILKKKAETEAVELPDDVAMFVASNVRTNVRELEGALLRLVARSSFDGKAITVASAQEALKRLINVAPTGLTTDTILREVASYFDVKIHDLKGQKRHRAIARPRMIAMYLTRQLTSMSFPEIGSRFGGRDHTTVMNAVRKIEGLKETDAVTQSVVSTLTDRLREN